MSLFQIGLLIFSIFVFCFCYWLASRPAWYGKIGSWKIDPAIRSARRKNGYWPIPDHWTSQWQRPLLPFSYCLRCGKWPFTGPELMYSRTAGFMTICSVCEKNVVAQELLRYARLVVDMNICRNFDPKFTHPDHAYAIDHFATVWEGLQDAVGLWEKKRREGLSRG